MKVLIAAGGTGGHLYPGIALARELKKHGAEIFFVIRKKETEEKILQSENIPYTQLNFEGLPRKISIRLFLFLPKLLFATLNTISLLKSLRPDIVVGMGGYLSFPVIIVAKLCSLPTVIHEQNLHPGLANRLLSPYVDKIAVSFEETIKFLPAKKTVYTGNPIREELKIVNLEETRKKFGFTKDKFTILIFGGSAGAHHINEVVVSTLPSIAQLREKLQVLHLTGEKDYSWIDENYRLHKIQAKVLPYLEEMGLAYACADLVISRAGASTLAEILALRKPALLIPYPYATGRHQELQAQYLSEKGCAYFISNADFSAPVFTNYIRDFLSHPERLKKVVSSIENLNLPPATKELANLILSSV